MILDMQQAPKSDTGIALDLNTVRFITCGSVDDGKSTLIGRMLLEASAVFDDELGAIQSSSTPSGQGGIDLSLLVDGLRAEREQGITIDVAYRYFNYAGRRFIVADTPGHEQYTRNMATGASTAQIAVLLVDSRKGILVQTRRHARIALMMGIRHIVLAVNKIDLVAYDQKKFESIVRDFTNFLGQSPCIMHAIPVSAADGDNVVRSSPNTPWYQGPPLLSCLSKIQSDELNVDRPFLMPVQLISRPDQDFRGIAGRIAEGSVRPGDVLHAYPSGAHLRVRSVLSGFSEVDSASSGDSITIVPGDHVDVSRGDVLAGKAASVQMTGGFEAKLLWFHERHLVPGREYLLKLATQERNACVTAINFKEDMNSGDCVAANALAMNEIAEVQISVSAPVACLSYSASRQLGSFILIDKLTFETVGAGMINRCLHQQRDLHWQTLEIGKAARSRQKGQNPKCIWFTGLSGSGKSTIANLLEKRLHALGHHTYLLDGDNIRHGLCRDLGFSEQDRVENIRRAAEVAKLMVDAGLIVLVSFISPFGSERQMARAMFEVGEFHEVFVDTPLQECERRDVKGLYAKARRGELRNLTGIDSPYEPPEAPEVHIRTIENSPEMCVDQICRAIELA